MEWREQSREEQGSRLDWFGMRRVSKIIEKKSEWIREKREEYIRLGRIRANRSDWSNRIILKIENQTRARRA